VPEIDKDTVLDTAELNIIIEQSNHKLLSGDEITFSGLISTFGIPESALNTKHTVKTVINSNQYSISITNFNLYNGTREDTGGGFTGRAYVPNKFRLLFNYSDTMGKQLGFRKVGTEQAITAYKTSISSSDPYQNENVIIANGTKYIIDESNNKIILKNNNIKLSGDDYILMRIKECDMLYNIAKNKTVTKYFAKINLSGLPNKILYDTFVNCPVIFNQPIDLSELDISFYTPDGILCEFNGIDHSFVVEIISIDYTPCETGKISTHAGY
jgi:hypothetical protein